MNPKVGQPAQFWKATNDPDKPDVFAAKILFVHDDGAVNLIVFDDVGHSRLEGAVWHDSTGRAEWWEPVPQ